MHTNRLLLLLALLALCVSLANAAHAADSNPHKWSGRGVFVFHGILFDFESRTWANGLESQTLENCSNAEYFCARTARTPVVLPRRCRAVNLGDEWTFAGITTRVVAVAKDPGWFVPGAPVVYLSAPGRRDFLFEYHNQLGVSRLIYDFTGKVDLVALARASKLDERANRQFSHGLITLDTFGPCTKPQ